MARLLAFFVASAGLLLGVAATPNVKNAGQEVFGIPLHMALTQLGLVAAISAVAIAVTLFVRYLGGRTAEVVADWVPSLVYPHFQARQAQGAELIQIHDMASRLLTGEISPLATMKKWYRDNPGTFWIMKNMRKGQAAPIDGYFCILPLRKNAADLIEKETITGADFTAEHITNPRSKPYALYIGGVAADGRRARGVIVSCLLQRLSDLHRKKKIWRVYTRPVNNKGLELVRRGKFEPVDPRVTDPLGRVHYVDLNDLLV